MVIKAIRLLSVVIYPPVIRVILMVLGLSGQSYWSYVTVEDALLL